MLTETKQLVNKRRFAELVGVSAGTVDRWLTDGRLQPDWRTPGGAPRFYWPPTTQRKEDTQ
jgi:predicted site-specific integrase-resolvase